MIKGIPSIRELNVALKTKCLYVKKCENQKLTPEMHSSFDKSQKWWYCMRRSSRKAPSICTSYLYFFSVSLKYIIFNRASHYEALVLTLYQKTAPGNRVSDRVLPYKSIIDEGPRIDRGVFVHVYPDERPYLTILPLMSCLRVLIAVSFLKA